MDTNETALFSKWSLLLFAIIIIAGFFVLFPGGKFLDTFDKKQIDLTSVQYLKVLLEKNPEDHTLRLRLTRELVAMGNLAEAQKTLNSLLAEKNPNENARFLMLDILFQQYFAETNDALKEAKQVILVKTIKDYYPKIKQASSLDWLAERSFQLGKPVLAAEIYQHLVTLLGEPQSFNHIATTQEIVWSLIGIHSAQAEEAAKDAHYYAIKEIEALLSAGKVNAAFARAKVYVPKFNKSATMLALGIKIAGYAKAPAQARDWGRLSLSRSDFNKKLLQAQIKRELGANEPKSSMAWVKKTLKNKPSTEINLLAFQINLAAALKDKKLTSALGFKLLAKKPNDIKLLTNQIGYEQVLKNHKSVRNLGLRLLAKKPKNPKYLTNQIYYEQALKNPKAVQKLGRRLLATNPKNPTFLTNQIQFEQALGNQAAAQKLGMRLLATAPKNPTFLTNQIHVEQALGNQAAVQKLGVRLLATKPNDPTFLANQIHFEQAVGNQDAVTALGLRLLKNKPNDPKLIAQQIQFELAAKNLTGALKYAQQQVAVNPNNIKAHQQLADIALWNIEQALTLKQWRWLYQKTGKENYITDAIKLGIALFKYDEVAEFYRDISSKRQLTEEEAASYYKVLQAAGFLDAGVTQLKNYVKKWPKHKTVWLYLAETEEEIARYHDAIKTLDIIGNNFGNTLEIDWRKVKIWLRLAEIDTAWEVLSDDVYSTETKKNEFWKLYSEISWSLGRDEAAKQGYSYLLKNNGLNGELFSRLIELNRGAGDDESQLELYLVGWKKYKHASYLYGAIDMAVRLKKTEQVNALITIAETETTLFEEDANIWIVKADIAIREKKVKKAKEFLLKAISINEDSLSARSALLWHMITHDSDVELAAYLAILIAKHGTNPDLWEPIATAYRRLALPNKAVEWYAKAVKNNPMAYVLLLSYAETLLEAGEDKKANVIRGFILTKLRPTMVDALPKTDSRAHEELKRRYAEALREEMGIDVSEKWFKFEQKQDKTLKRALFDEYRITWLLAQSRLRSARHYLYKEVSKRVQLAAWQKMAIAVYDNDINKIEQILKSPKKLLKTDVVVGLQKVGREQESLIMARDYLNADQQVNERDVLRRQAASLGIRNPNGFATRLKTENLSGLDLISFKSTAAVTRVQNTFWADYEYLDLSSSSPSLIVHSDQSQEQNLSLKWQHRELHNEYWLKTRASLREDQDLLSVEAGARRYIWEGWSVTLEGSYNKTSDESDAFRLLGAKDNITLSLEGEIDKRNYFSANIQGNHYKTRSGDTLGTGFIAGMQFGHRIHFEHPSINVNLHGTISQASLVDKLPFEIQRSLGTDAGIGRILSDSYKELGLNLTIYDGELRPFGFVEQNLHYYLDLGLFVSDPFSGLGMSAEAGVGVRVFEEDDLSLIGRYVDSQGGVNSIATKAVELRYSIRFD
ncbi:MAG: tetratricopeptide repeat protein [Methylococcales bacterium]|nr:tetratricopeptide repeat protein [Methylococcales bacterium]